MIGLGRCIAAVKTITKTIARNKERISHRKILMQDKEEEDIDSVRISRKKN